MVGRTVGDGRGNSAGTPGSRLQGDSAQPTIGNPRCGTRTLDGAAICLFTRMMFYFYCPAILGCHASRGVREQETPPSVGLGCLGLWVWGLQNKK